MVISILHQVKAYPKKYYVDKALMASYYPGYGYSVTATVKGKKHTLWLDDEKWCLHEVKNNSPF